MYIISSKSKKFGDIEKGTNIYYIDPHLRSVEPCYVLGTFYEEGKPDLINITVVIVPKAERMKPLNALDTGKLRKIQFRVPKLLDIALVATNPPTLYSPEEETLLRWLKFK